MKKVILIFLLLSVVSASFLFAGGLDNFLNGAENFVNKGENEINKIYNNGNVNNFVNKIKKKANEIYNQNSGSISKVKNFVNNTINNSGKSVSNFLDEAEKSNPRLWKSAQNSVNKFLNENGEEIFNRAKKIGKWLYTRGNNVWHKLDKYPHLKKAIVIAVNVESGGMITESRLDVQLASIMMRLMQDPSVNEDTLLSTLNSAMSVENGENDLSVISLLNILPGLTTQYGSYTPSFVNLYSNLFTLESKNPNWTISDAQNYVKSLLNTLNEPNVNRNRVVQVFLQVSQTACDQNLNYSQTSKMLKQNLENGNQVHASKNSSVISGVQRTPKSQNPSLPTKKFVNSSIAYIVLLGVIGFFLWILGYKILRKIAWNRWFASCLLFLAGFTFSYFVCSVQESVAVVVGIIAGIIGLAIPKYLYYLLAFLTGCEIGYIATMVFMANYGQNRSLAMVIAVVIGILTVKLNRFATILATSMIGSWTLIFATIDVLKIESVKFSLPAQSLAMSQNVLTKIHMVLGEISNQFYYLAHLLNIGSVYQANFYNFLSVDNMIKQSEAFSFFILWTVLVVLGMAIQYVTSRNKKVKTESTKEKLLEVKSESN